MGVRSHRPKRDDLVQDGVRILENHPHEIAMQQLFPRIEAKAMQAVKVVPIDLYFYSKLKTGRRCSCWSVSSSPDSLCLACYGTGIVGGFNKYGTHTEVIDTTFPNIRSVNVIPDYSRKTKPIEFVLVNGATDGFIEARLFLKTNVGVIDAIRVSNRRPMNTDIDAYIRSPAEPEYVPFTRANFVMRLFNPWVDVKFRLRRPTTLANSPRFALAYLRYRRLVDPRIQANIPRTQKSIMLQDLGVSEDWQHQRFWFPSVLRNVTTEDFVASLHDDTRWKINTVDEFAPANQLLSWDVDTRLVQVYEPFDTVPL